ncbi:FKB10, partial [Symbiodinium microadriaticum]
ELQLPPEDQALYNSLTKIKELEEMLRRKDEEIKAVKLKRFEELEVEVVQDKLRNVKAIQRGKHMDEWSTDELAAFFTELKMEQYCHFLYTQRVDGLLFINLAEGEWADMGITNRFHVRKLQLIMVQYRARYERKKKKIELGEDEYEEDEDEIGTEYDPDDLSDMIRQEGMSESDSEEELQ